MASSVAVAWLVRRGVILGKMLPLSLIMIGAWLIVRTRVSFGYPYAQTIPWFGWWLTLLGLVGVFFSGQRAQDGLHGGKRTIR